MGNKWRGSRHLQLEKDFDEIIKIRRSGLFMPGVRWDKTVFAKI